MSRASSLRLLVAFAAAACSDSVFQNLGNGPPIGFAASYGIWTPGPGDDCTAEIHNGYSVVGPDRKLYPTWHPPVDPVTGARSGTITAATRAGRRCTRASGPFRSATRTSSSTSTTPRTPAT